MKSVLTSPETEESIARAFDSIAEESLKAAVEFLEDIEEFKELIGGQPGVGRRYKGNVRRFMIGKFRYWGYYEETGKEILFIGIMHTSRGKNFVPYGNND